MDESKAEPSQSLTIIVTDAQLLRESGMCILTVQYWNV